MSGCESRAYHNIRAALFFLYVNDPKTTSNNNNYKMRLKIGIKKNKS